MQDVNGFRHTSFARPLDEPTATARPALAATPITPLAMETNLIDNPSFDHWCGDDLCDWETVSGKIERVGSWHERDYAVSFVEQGTRITQVSTQGLSVGVLSYDGGVFAGLLADRDLDPPVGDAAEALRAALDEL